MQFQLREYTVRPGEMTQWLEEWRSQIAPLRRRHGFRIVGAWSVDDTEQFVWILAHDGRKSWQEAEAKYYQSPERKAMNPDPARHLAHTQARMMTAVPTPPG